VETGFVLVGKIVGQGPSRIILVSSLIDEGPHAARSAGHHKADRVYQQRELELLQLADGDLMFIGDCHLHPGCLDRCSGGDFQTDLGNVRISRTKEMLFVIATAASAHWHSRVSDSNYRAGLKLDFFYLGKSSGYEYRHIRPEIVEGKAITVSTSLRQFATSNPVRARLDFDNLRRLASYEMTVSELAADGQLRPSIAMLHKTLGFRTIIAFGPTPAEHTEVFVDTGKELLQYHPASLDGNEICGQIWFTPLVLMVEREMTEHDHSNVTKTNETPADAWSESAGKQLGGPIGVQDRGKLSTSEQGARREDSGSNGPVSIRR
jgi:hypothetical protein